MQERFLKVVPHDSAKAEPFSYDAKTKTIYIAPEAHVRKHLQRLSAYEGLASNEIYTYCKRLVHLAKTLEGDSIGWLLKPLELMLEERRSTSDKIIMLAGELGHKDLAKPLSPTIAADIAKAHSKQVFEDVVLLQEMIQANSRLTD